MNTSDLNIDLREWTKQEDDQLHTLYNVDMLTIMEIYEKMHIYPWFINTRLYEQKYTKAEDDSRGYNDFKDSSLYKQSPKIIKYLKYMSGIAGIACSY